ncbi:MAG: hypothetical protein NTY74_14265 [Ignavibacteriae bacterium]|nr:hypothetical protein [Ignavibacteriota bacterium]
MKKAVLVLLAIFLMSGYSFSQNKYYIPSEDAYFNIEFEDDNRNNVEEYAGLYEYVYPGFLETLEYAGDGMYEGITLNFDNGILSIKSYGIVEGMEGDATNEYVVKPNIEKNILTFIYDMDGGAKFEGIFVKGRYNKNNREVTVSGILKKDNEFYIKKD